jgi:hypothetical protein
LLAKLAAIPDTTRAFTATPQDVGRRFGLSPEILELLIERGVPHAVHDGDPYLDVRDVRTVAMHLGFGPAAAAARRFWATGLNDASRGDHTRYELYYRSGCPDPGHAPECHYRMAVPGGHVERVVGADHTGPLYSVQMSLDTDWPAFPAEWRGLLDVLDGMDFIILPRDLRLDLDFARDVGIADCVSGTELLVREATRWGVPVRRSFGVIVTPPYSSRHNWAEFRIGNRWVPIDPLFVNALRTWGLLDPDAWPVDRSPGALYARVGAQQGPFLTHDGTDLKTTLLTRRIRG